MTTTIDPKLMLAEIAAGKHDLAAVQTAIRACLEKGLASIRWRLDLEGLSPIGDGELTLDELEVIERTVGVSWDQIDPIKSARCARAVIAAAYRRRGETPEAAAGLAGKLTMDQVVDAYRLVEARPADPS